MIKIQCNMEGIDIAVNFIVINNDIEEVKKYILNKLRKMDL